MEKMTITVSDILKCLSTLAPPEWKMDWDNVGLLCGRRDKAVSTVLVALDPFEDVCREAYEIGADLIVTHHPLIFQPMKAVTGDTSIGRAILLLAARDIAAVNAHTNLDVAPGGVNDVLAERLGLADISVVKPLGTDTAGRPYGLLRAGNVPEMPLADFLSRVTERLHCQGLRYVNSDRPVRHVAVGGGACAGELMDAFDAGCDTFVTADVKYNQFWDAQDLGMNLIDAGHFPTENPVCQVFAEKIKENFPQLSVKISQNHRDCMNFFP